MYHDLFAYVQIWICEFCGTSNEIEVVVEELPTKEMTTYLIFPAPATVTQQALESNIHGVTDSVVVFCIDTSGSMGVTTEVDSTLRILYCNLQVLVVILTFYSSCQFQIAGKVELKGHDRVCALSASLNAEGEDQSLPRQRRDVTYVSRLQVQLR